MCVLASLGVLLCAAGCVGVQAEQYPEARTGSVAHEVGVASSDPVSSDSVSSDSVLFGGSPPAVPSTAAPPVKSSRAAPPGRGGLASAPDVTRAALAAVGAPYRRGGRSPATGFDCSGLVSWSYEQVGIALPRSAREQISFGRPVRKNELQPGDIVVFNRVRSPSGYHSGIYVGDDHFVHSPSSGKTVTKERLDSAYYGSRFAGARRVPRDLGRPVSPDDFNAKIREAALAVKSAGGKSASAGKARGKKKYPAVSAGTGPRTKQAAAPPIVLRTVQASSSKKGVKQRTESKDKPGRTITGQRQTTDAGGNG